MVFLSVSPTLVLGISVTKRIRSGSRAGEAFEEEEPADVVLGDVGAGRGDHQCQRSLLPLVMGDAHDGDVEDAGMGDDGVLDVDGGDPLPVALDDVLDAADDLEPVVVDLCEVHDAAAPAELVIAGELGLAPAGEGALGLREVTYTLRAL